MKRQSLNQSGMISITVTLVIMIIITLVVSSFAVIVRREQRQTLDRQLSTQAFYAAESGLEDARYALTSGDPNKRITDSDTVNSCESGSPNNFNEIMQTQKGITLDPKISDNVEYTCVLIDMKPLNFKKTFNLSDGTYLVRMSSDSNISSLRFSWQGTSPAPYVNNPDFKLPMTGLSNPMLRVNVFPGIGSSGASINDMRDGAHSVFMYPNPGGPTSLPGSIDYVGRNDTNRGGPNVNNATRGRQGQIISGNCNEARADSLDCSAVITDLNHPAAEKGSGEEYYVAIRPLYKSAEVEIEALNGGTPVPIVGSQAVVDVTGRAQDVLRRVQARIPLNSNTFAGKLPDGALETRDELCKLLDVGGSSIRDNCAEVDIMLGSAPPSTPPPSGGGGGSGSGDAGFDDGDDRDSDSGRGGVIWDIRLTNTSDNPDSIVARCEWDFGDGEPPKTNACYRGDRQTYTYQATNPIQCRIYTVTLRIWFNNGFSPRDVQKNNFYIPMGNQGQDECAGRYRTYRP